jgi:hypothetical protein
MDRPPRNKPENLRSANRNRNNADNNHNLIAMNLAAELRAQLKGRPCGALTNDMRVRIEAADACKSTSSSRRTTSRSRCLPANRTTVGC